MAYDTRLEKRIDAQATVLGMKFRKKKMFGGLAYFAKGGNIAFAIRGDELLFRLNHGEEQDVLDWPGVHTAIMGRRLMSNWLQADGVAIENDESLAEFMTIGYDYALSLPPKR